MRGDADLRAKVLAAALDRDYEAWEDAYAAWMRAPDPETEAEARRCLDALPDRPEQLRFGSW